MNLREIPVDRLTSGLRVYVKALDVFGRVTPNLQQVVCETPMKGYVYIITASSLLYTDTTGVGDAS